MATLKLKNCPFCGSKAKIINIVDELDDEFYMVECENEKCGAGCTFGEGTKPQISKRWNNRNGSIIVNNYGNGEQIKNEGHLTIKI